MSWSRSSPSPPLTPPTSESENDTHAPDDERDAFFPGSSTSARYQPRTLPTSSPHPFAASTKANRAPPLYEKKLFTPPATPPEPPKKTTPIKPEVQREESRASLHASLSLDESEQKLWDTAISSAIDGATAEIDLSSNNLTYIPPSLIDLKNLVVLPKDSHRPQSPASVSLRTFKRSATAPALLPSPRISGTRPFLPTTTVAVLNPSSSAQGKQNHSYTKCEIQLYLMNNRIRVLPRELFSLDCLVVLSLRQNKLTSLPPAIARLTRLRELNVASNRLSYLPADILDLRLASLIVHPNPFTPLPPGTIDVKRTRYLGPLKRGPSVPALSELIIRFILASDISGEKSTWLETRLHPTQTIDSLLLPSHFQRIVQASTGHGLASDNGTNAEDDVTANQCPNPVHKKSRFLRGTHVSNRRFCTPAETRMEWVSVVAGVELGENPQSWVPVLWRGCSKGCLEFLAKEEISEGNAAPAFVAGKGNAGEEFEFSDGE